MKETDSSELELALANIKLTYLYRDGGNYKNWGEVIFSNPEQRTVEEIRKMIAPTLIDNAFFYVEDWDLPDLHFSEYPWDDEIDHDWHQFHSLSLTREEASASIESFLCRRHPLRNAIAHLL